MKEESIKLILPCPISINTAYSGKAKRYKSDQYKEWIEKARIAYLKCDTRYNITGDSWLFVEYDFYFPIFNKDWTKKVKDVWNYEKVLSDFLCSEIPWLLDHKFKTIVLRKHDSEANEVHITIKEIKKV